MGHRPTQSLAGAGPKRTRKHRGLIRVAHETMMHVRRLARAARIARAPSLGLNTLIHKHVRR